MVRIWVESGGIHPKRATQGSAGYDLHSMDRVELTPGESKLVRTGVYIAIPRGYEGQVRGRSGLAMRGLSVHLGTIDSDYRGEVCVIAQSSTDFIIERGSRIAQLVVSPVAMMQPFIVASKDELGSTSRGAGGFGSTGE